MRIQRLLKILPVALCDSVAVAVAALMAWWIHYAKFAIDINFNDHFLLETVRMLPVIIAGTVVVFYFLGMYVSLWQYAGVREAIRVFIGVAVVTGSEGCSSLSKSNALPPLFIKSRVAVPIVTP